LWNVPLARTIDKNKCLIKLSQGLSQIRKKHITKESDEIKYKSERPKRMKKVEGDHRKRCA
jgi:hypothetical protein